jgi:hypothetical protein
LNARCRVSGPRCRKLLGHGASFLSQYPLEAHSLRVAPPVAATITSRFC